MKTLKKNNTGFSLVELIVVILIMAIIAVALAPQVMKWVDQSKVSTDVNNRANLKSSMDAAVASYLAEGNKIKSGTKVFIIDKNGFSGTDTTALKAVGDNFPSAVDEVTNMFWPEFKSSENGYFQITILDNGAVKVEVYGGVSGADYGDGRTQP